MTNLISDYVNKSHTNITNTLHEVQVKPVNAGVVNSQNLRDEFVKEHKKNGLFERFYNFLKNKTHFGSGSQNVEQSIKDYENGGKTEEDVKDEIQKYRTSQKNSQQLLGDVVAATTAAGSYFTVTNGLNKIRTLTAINKGKLTGIAGAIFGNGESKVKFLNNIRKMLEGLNKRSIIGLGVLFAALSAGIMKQFVLDINRIGSKEFKFDKKNKPPKEERKQIRKAERKERTKDFFTGALSGVFAPLIGIAGGIVGVPAFLAANFGTRYLTQNKDKKSLNDFAEKYKDNAAINTVTAGIMAVPLLRKANYSKVLNKNLAKVFEKLKDSNLTNPFGNNKTAYTQLEDTLLNSNSIKKIIDDRIDDSDKIRLLTDENIFAAKFIQISNNWHYSDLSSALRENCPPTRTVEEAAEFISKTFGKKYNVTKQLGVGTVAETYLAKDTETGKEVCIKILKKGINAEKIDRDKLKFAELVKSQVQDPKEQEYLLRNLDDLAEGIRKEVDFTNEMEAAKNLKPYTKMANVVQPIEVKDNIYVMEKANGISLKTLQEYISLVADKKYYLKMINTDTDDLYGFYQRQINEINAKLEALRAKSPDFNLDGLSSKELKKLLYEYILVNTEQFHAINKNGKVLHADIHPGNIFIDLDALKSGKGKLLTLIDTGNTVNMSKVQSLNALKLTQYINRGDVKDITRYVLDGAVLPDGMTKEAAVEIMEKELNKFFFDNNTKIELMTNDSMLKLTSNIMRKYNIFPSDTQLNFEKAKKSAMNSFKSFLQSFFQKKYSGIDDDSKVEVGITAAKLTKDAGEMLYKYVLAGKLQDMRNLGQIGFKELLRQNKNMLKTNSEDYLVYKFKQQLNGKTSDLDTMFGV